MYIVINALTAEIAFTINMAKKSTPIPGLSFSWKRALGISQAKQKIARETGIPLSKQGLERKIGNTIPQFVIRIVHKKVGSLINILYLYG